MSLITKIFRKPADPPAAVGKTPQWWIDNGWLTIRAIDFYGKIHPSSSGRWTVAYAQGNATAPNDPEGQVVLLDNHKAQVVAHITDLQRPFGAVSSDAGVFAVHDALLGEGPSAQVLAYSTNGELLYSRKYLANVATLGISTCGRYVAVQTLNSDRDGNLFEVLDIKYKAIAFSVDPTAGFANDYRFEVGPENLRRVFSVHKDLGVFAYDENGQFLDAPQLSEALLNKGDFAQKLRALQSLLSVDNSPQAAHRALEVADQALGTVPPHLEAWAALAHRLKGEAYERLSEPAAAIDSYERALSFDPKAGVRRALGRLRKATQNSAKNR